MSHLLSTENYEKISEFIYRKSGIFFQEQKYYEKLANHIDSRCRELDFDSFKKYFFKIRFDDINGEEFQYLMNAITVNETYFFREKEQFEVLVDKVLPELHEKVSQKRPLRILSSPCSSGEEPYSIILHIMQNKNFYKDIDIEVVGIDIDSSVVKKAQTAKFSERSVSAIPEDILLKCFVNKVDGYEICKEIQASVNFHVVNVFDKEQMIKLGKFDVIFSRNMLIYFDDASRKDVSMTYYDMLNPEGYVFLGHAEHMDRIVSVFNEKRINNTVVYQK